MKIQSLFVVSLICFFCSGAYAEQAASTEAGAAATGLCKDGTPYTGATKKGACRGHKGIKEWYGDKAAATSAPAATTATAVAAPAAVVAATPAAPSGAATGMCKDGTEYTGASKKGACRGHKGVKEWYADKQAAAPSPATVAPAATTATVPATAVPATPVAPSGTATGMCKDGTEYTGASKRGACRGHKGVKEWYADKAPAAETATPAVTPAPAVVAPAVTAPAATTTPPASAVAATAPAAGSGQVWVNTHSKIYHCEGTKFFGKTKEGEYMSEADAQAKGFKANRNKACH